MRINTSGKVGIGTYNPSNFTYYRITSADSEINLLMGNQGRRFYTVWIQVDVKWHLCKIDGGG